MIRNSILAACAVFAAAPRPAAQEPPLLFTLEFNGRQVPVEADKTQEIDTGSGRVKVTLRVSPYRIFSEGGVTFHYPRGYAWKQNVTAPGVSAWELKLGAHVITVKHRKDAGTAEDEMKMMADAVGRVFKGSMQAEDVLELAGCKVKGIRLDYDLGPMKGRTTFFPFQSGPDAVVLMIADGPSMDGKPEKTAEEAMKMLRESFHVKGT